MACSPFSRSTGRSGPWTGLELELIGDPAAAHLDSAEVIRLALARLYELPELSA
jgi:hypothetical protein